MARKKTYLVAMEEVASGEYNLVVAPSLEISTMAQMDKYIKANLPGKKLVIFRDMDEVIHYAPVEVLKRVQS